MNLVGFLIRPGPEGVNSRRVVRLDASVLQAALIPILLTFLAVLSPAVHANTIHVPGDEPTIQAGINAASAGDVVIVACGRYYEYDITLTSGVSLISATGKPGCVTIDAEQQGRVFYCYDVDNSTSIEGFTITGGLATGTSPDYNGGAMYCEDSYLTITDCVFAGNEADNHAGGIYCLHSSPSISNCVFTNNTANVRGGGLLCISSSSPTITDCEFTRNNAEKGGAVDCFSNCSPVITGCTMSGNSVSGVGGGISCTNNSPVTIDNTIIAFSTVGEAVYCDGTSAVTLTCCDVYGNAGGDWTGCIAGQNGSNGNISANPLFCDLAYDNYRLTSGSPCAAANSPPGCGQIGAYGTDCCRIWYILSDGSGDAPTIQAGINSAVACDTVLVAAGTYFEHDIVMKNGVVAKSGSGPDVTIIDASQNGRVVYCENTDHTTAIYGFTLTGGLTSGPVPPDFSGAGIYCTSSSPAINNCTFSNNSADWSGGGMYLDGTSSPALEGCRFYNNSAGWLGGAIYCAGSPTISNCTLSGNSTSSSVHDGGGALYSAGGSPVLTNSVFSGNSTPAFGGGIFFSSSAATITGCTFFGNGANNAGGGIHCYLVFPMITSCTFSGNDAPSGGGISFAHYFAAHDPRPLLPADLVASTGATAADSLTLANTIIAFSTQGEAMWCDGPTNSAITCCDIYGNAGGDWVGCIAGQDGVNGNISEDPLFCDAENGEFYLQEGSPCAPFTEPNPQCDLIGAWPVGCQTPEGVISPLIINFDTVSVGGYLDEDFTITNVGGGTLTGTVSESCDHYTIISGGGSYSLAASEYLTTTVRYEPTSGGTHDCTIETGCSSCDDVSCSGVAAGGTGIAIVRSDKLVLYQNCPNPFNPNTTISFTLPEKTRAELSVYDVDGKLVAVLVNDALDKGFKEVTWDGKDYHGIPVSSGVYFYRLKAGKQVLTRKMVVLK